MNGFFVTGGTMKPDAGSYIRREADQQLYDAVRAGEYCSVLTTRQMGKSSLMARIAFRLREEGTACAIVDLQGKGDAPAPEQWYYGVVKQIAVSLALSAGWSEWWKRQELLLPSHRMTDFFSEVLLKELTGPVVVFVDEVDWMIRLPFSDEFFAAIRSCFNRRATEPVFERLTFVLLGAAAPAQLIKDPTRTPFNVGRGIELTDFTAGEARPLASHLAGRQSSYEGEALLARILYWTDGHPYLTQMLCAAVLETDGDGKTTQDFVDSVVRDRLLSTRGRQEENNLKFVAERLTQATGDLRRVLQVYRSVLAGKEVKDEPASLVHTSLRLSGVVKPDAERRLRVRNRIYREVFDENWVRQQMPLDQRKILGAAAAAVLLAIAAVWYLLIYPRPYVVALETASQDVQIAYNAFDALNRPFHRAQAEELLAQFWERRGDRDRAILVRAKYSSRGKLAGLIGADYPFLKRTLRPGGAVQAVAFSPDGRLLAVASNVAPRYTVELFEVSTGREVLRLPHSGVVYHVAFSRDGKYLATFSFANGEETAPCPDDPARTCSVERMFQLRAFALDAGVQISQHRVNDRVGALTSDSADGLLAVLDQAGRVVDLSTGRTVSTLPGADYFSSVAISPDGKLEAGCRFDLTAVVFDRSTGRQVSRLAQVGTEPDAIAFSPQNNFVATGSRDYSAQVFDAKTGKEISRLNEGEAIEAVAFSPAGEWVATGSQDWTARVFKAATGREGIRFDHEESVLTVAFSPDGQLLATGSTDGTSRLFEVKTPLATGPTDRPFENAITRAALSIDGKRAVASFVDWTSRVLDIETGKQVSDFSAPGPVNAIAFSPDGASIAIGVGSIENEALLLEAATGRELIRLPRQELITAVAFSPDGRFLATGTYEKTARVFEASTGNEVHLFQLQNTVTAVNFSADGKLLATGSSEGLALAFDIQTGKEVLRLPQTGSVSGVALNPDGTLFVTNSGNWLHLYQHDRARWRPIANRFMPGIRRGTLRFTADRSCPKCVEVLRDVPGDPIKPERVNFDEDAPAVSPDAPRSVAEWSARLGLTIDSRGHIAER